MSVKIQTNEVVLVSTDKLVLNEVGENIYSTPNNYNEMLENISMFGLVQPILVNLNDFKVISGNLRLKIARELGMEVVPVIFVELSSNEMDISFISSNFQREKSILDKYRELQFINKIFNLVKGSRTDLNPQLKEEKVRKDQMKKSLTTYEVNSLNRINKLAQEQFGENYQEIVEKDIIDLQEKKGSLNILVQKYEKGFINPNVQEVKTKPLVNKEQVISQLKKVLNKLPVEQHREVLETMLSEYSYQMVS